METRLVKFLRGNQINLWKIFCKEQTDKGPGMLYITLEGDNVGVAYYPVDKIPREEHKKEFKEKFDMLENDKVSEIEIKDKWIIYMPTIETNSLPYAPIFYIVLEELTGDNKYCNFFVGFPQDEDGKLKYLMIGDIPNKI